MIKKIDSMGRIVIPAEIRKEMNWSLGDELDISVDDGVVKVKKIFNSKRCMVCGSDMNLITKGSLVVCQNCLDKLKEII